jgi:hypothetical protein
MSIAVVLRTAGSPHGHLFFPSGKGLHTCQYPPEPEPVPEVLDL